MGAVAVVVHGVIGAGKVLNVDDLVSQVGVV
jgi:hypothetical protein